MLYHIIIRPHRSTTYVDAAYCYRSSSVVCQSVFRSVTLVSPAKTAAPIELPFGLRTCVDRWNDVLDWGPDPPMRRGNVLSLVQNQIVATALKYRQKTISHESRSRIHEDWLVPRGLCRQLTFQDCPQRHLVDANKVFNLMAFCSLFVHD